MVTAGKGGIFCQGDVQRVWVADVEGNRSNLEKTSTQGALDLGTRVAIFGSTILIAGSFNRDFQNITYAKTVSKALLPTSQSTAPPGSFKVVTSTAQREADDLKRSREEEDTIRESKKFKADNEMVDGGSALANGNTDGPGAASEDEDDMDMDDDDDDGEAGESSSLILRYKCCRGVWHCLFLFCIYNPRPED